jgi:hypothetical protein
MRHPWVAQVLFLLYFVGFLVGSGDARRIHARSPHERVLVELVRNDASQAYGMKLVTQNAGPSLLTEVYVESVVAGSPADGLIFRGDCIEFVNGAHRLVLHLPNLSIIATF